MQQKEKFIQIDRLTDEELEDSKRLFDQFIESGLSLEQFKRKVPGSLRKLRKSFIIQKERNPFEYLDALLINGYAAELNLQIQFVTALGKLLINPEVVRGLHFLELDSLSNLDMTEVAYLLGTYRGLIRGASAPTTTSRIFQRIYTRPLICDEDNPAYQKEVGYFYQTIPDYMREKALDLHLFDRLVDHLQKENFKVTRGAIDEIYSYYDKGRLKEVTKPKMLQKIGWSHPYIFKRDK